MGYFGELQSGELKLTHETEQSISDMFRSVEKITMQVQETEDEFIFRTINSWSKDTYDIALEKDELIKAIGLIRMYREHGTNISERWTTAVSQSHELSRAYRKGLQDGIDKEHVRIMKLLDGVCEKEG